MPSRPTRADLFVWASRDVLARNPHLARQDGAGRAEEQQAVSTPARSSECAKRAANGPPGDARYGRDEVTGRAYRSRTEARWAAEHPDDRFEPVGIRTACGVYWPDFVQLYCTGVRHLIEVKGSYIRDRAMHKVKAAIRPAMRLGYTAIKLAQWDGKAWQVTTVKEG